MEELKCDFYAYTQRLLKPSDRPKTEWYVFFFFFGFSVFDSVCLLQTSTHSLFVHGVLYNWSGVDPKTGFPNSKIKI